MRLGVVRLLGGRLVVSATQAGDAVQVDTLPASVRFSVGSEGRLSLFQDTDGVYLDVAMIRGDADVTTAMSATSVFAGSRVVVRSGQPPSEEMAFNSAESDPFYDWSNSLLDERRGTTSAQYLPSDLNGYSASFDQERIVELSRAVRLRLVSDRGGRMAPVLSRTLVPA